MRWFISDTHFGHEKVIEYDDRPFKDAKEMNRKMMEKWNNVVKPTDTVYHLGDFAFMPNERAKFILKQLNGFKILIRGNHDKSEDACYQMGWDFVCDGIVVRLDGHSCLCVHDPAGGTSGYFNLHGHTHLYNGDPYGLCLCCNLWDYAPVSEKTLVKEIVKRKKQQKDMGNPITY